MISYMCGRCKERFETDNMIYIIETPNININLCVDCAIEIEDDLMHLAYNTTTNDANCEGGENEC